MSTKNRVLAALLVASVLAFAALAGCMTDEGTDPGDGTTGDGNESDGGGGDGGDVVTEEQAYADYQSALSAFESAEEAPRRFSMMAHAEALNSSDEMSLDMNVLMDLDRSIVIASIETEGEGQSSGGFSFGAEEFVFGQVHKTTFMGPRSGVFGLYNESAEPVDDPSDLSTGDGAAPTPGAGGFDDPRDFLSVMDNASREGLTSVTPTNYGGRPAIEMHFTVNESGQTGDMVAVMWTDPARFAYFEATMQDPEAEDELSQNGRIRVDFAYDADATHALEAALVRAEALTFLNVDDQEAAFGGFGEPETLKNYTIQPSANAGSIPMEQVEIHVYRSGSEDGPGKTEPVLTMPLEDGVAENDAVRVTFEDVDADGNVSPGDRMTVEFLDEEDTDYTVGLYDEETGLFLAPGAGVLAMLLAGLGAALVIGRRR